MRKRSGLLQSYMDYCDSDSVWKLKFMMNRIEGTLHWYEQQNEKMICIEDHTAICEGACIKEGFNFYDVFTHIVGHRRKRDHGCHL